MCGYIATASVYTAMFRLQLDLANAEKKVSALEGQLDKILKDKNKAIEELTRKNSAISEQLNAALAEIERLKLQQQPNDELKEQLAKALRELEELKKQYVACNNIEMLLFCILHFLTEMLPLTHN